MKKYISTTPQETVENFAKYLVELIENKKDDKFNIALSGGNTPKLLFYYLKENYLNKIDWGNVHFYWGDERCVPPDSEESNFGNAFDLFLNSEEIPSKNIHRILGENIPEEEAEVYSEIILVNLPIVNKLPQFDLIWLGLGDDGHTASIFPNQMEILNSNKICEVAEHPESGQKRITLTGNVINNAKNISFLVTGENKAQVINEIFNKKNNFEHYPASHIKAEKGELNWFLDENAASKL